MLAENFADYANNVNIPNIRREPRSYTIRFNPDIQNILADICDPSTKTLNHIVNNMLSFAIDSKDFPRSFDSNIKSFNKDYTDNRVRIYVKNYNIIKAISETTGEAMGSIVNRMLIYAMENCDNPEEFAYSPHIKQIRNRHTASYTDIPIPLPAETNKLASVTIRYAQPSNSDSDLETELSSTAVRLTPNNRKIVAALKRDLGIPLSTTVNRIVAETVNESNYDSYVAKLKNTYGPYDCAANITVNTPKSISLSQPATSAPINSTAPVSNPNSSTVLSDILGLLPETHIVSICDKNSDPLFIGHIADIPNEIASKTIICIKAQNFQNMCMQIDF